MAEKDLQKIIVITGASQGIGYETARIFLENGHSVVICSSNSQNLEKSAASLETLSLKGRLLAVPCDVSDASQVQSLFNQALERFGPVDVLINNAATITVKPILEIEEESWDQILDTNLKGAFLCAQAAFRQMKHRGGQIINVSSLSGIRGTEKFPGFLPYSVSKFGMIGLTECLGVEGKPYQIRCNAIAPGAVNTEMLKKAAPSLKTKTEPVEMAKLLYWMADENQSGSLNGSVIEIHSNE